MKQIDKDFTSIKFKPSLQRHNIPALQIGSRTIFNLKRNRKGVTSEKYKIDGFNGKSISLEIFRPENLKGVLPVLYYIHGGGFIFAAGPFHKEVICDFALKLNCAVVYIDYSLAPKFRYPHGLEDCYIGVKWIIENADNLNIDKNNIGIYGNSAGGALTVGVSYLLKERLNKVLKFQMLVYPVIDRKMNTESMRTFSDTPVWDSELNRKMWELYLPEERDDISYASPVDIGDPSFMPYTYIEVAEFDCLRDEGINYYNLLKGRGVKTILNKTKGTIHGFEIKYSSKITKSAIKHRINFAKKYFYKNS